MNASPLDPLRPLFGEQLQELAGTVVSGEVPLTTAVANRLIAQKLATVNAPILSAEVHTQPGEAVVVHLRPKPPIPALKVDIRVERQPQLPADPVLVLRWELRGLGPLAFLAAPVVSYFRKLPPGITLDGDRIRVDIREILRSQGFAEVVPLLTGLRVLTRDNMFLVQFEMRR